MITLTQLNHKSQIYIIQKEKQIMRTLPHNADTRPTQTNTIPEDNRIITTKEQILRRLPDVFEGIGKFPGKPYEIQLDPKGTTQANPLQAHTNIPERCLQARNQQNAKGRSPETGAGSNPMDKQLCAC